MSNGMINLGMVEVRSLNEYREYSLIKTILNMPQYIFAKTITATLDVLKVAIDTF